MKRFIVTLLMFAAVLALMTGCSKHTSDIAEQNAQNEIDAEAYMATQATGSREDKLKGPDPNVPQPKSMPIFSVKDGGKGLEMNMEACDEVNEDELVKQLISYGTLPETAQLVKADTANNTLEFTGAPDLTPRQAIAIINTFVQNMDWKGQITLKADGEEIMTSGYDSDYKNITDDYQGGADDVDLSAGGPGAK